MPGKIESTTNKIETDFETDKTETISHNSYTIDFEILDFKTRMFKGFENVVYYNNSESPIESVFFNIPINSPHLYKNNEDKGYLNLDTVTVNNEEVQYTLSDSTLEIKLNDNLPQKENINIAFGFEGYIPKSNAYFGASDDVIWISNMLPVLAVLDNRGWHTDISYSIGSPYFTDISNYTFNITTPNDYIVVGPSSQIVNYSDDNKQVTNFEENLIRNFSFAIYDKDSYTFETFSFDSSIDLNFHYHSNLSESERNKIFRFIEECAETLNFFINDIGTYPYTQLNFLEVGYTKSIGFSNSQMIFLNSDTLFEAIKNKDITKLIAKQWFYNIIGSDQIKTPWISEGMSSLLSDLANYDCNMVSTIIEANYNNLSSKILEIQNSSLLGDLSAYKNDDEYYQIQVLRSKLMIYSLREKLGAENFKLFLKEYYNHFAFKTVTKNDFIELAEQFYEGSLEEFFYNWLESYTLPPIG